MTTTAKITESNWYPDEKLLITHISGDVDSADVDQWETSLRSALAQIEPNERFRIFVNLHGFKATDLTAHKRFRTIIPLLLADYGWKVGYVDLFGEEANVLTYANTRGIRCVAAAHCHQDSTKMDLYESRFSRTNEHFFTNPAEAEQWIRTLAVV